MFEKEAKEYAIDAPPPFSVAREAFQKGAEFGYNKANELADVQKEQLTKARELIKNIIRATWGEGWNYSLDWKVKAEQFLSEVEK